MIKKFIDNAPEEEGCQLILNEELSHQELASIEAVDANSDYESELYEGEFESAWINCDRESAEAIKAILIESGWIEAKTF